MRFITVASQAMFYLGINIYISYSEFLFIEKWTLFYLFFKSSTIDNVFWPTFTRFFILYFFLSTFRCQNVALRKEYVHLVESVRENGGEAKIFSSMHMSGERKYIFLLNLSLNNIV